ncbi:MAG: hypothetical protein QOJ88_1021 [Pyrinomonadaceae bacterium]|nr:hypothetical protein [Pyrinomonadaceae bacterium]
MSDVWWGKESRVGTGRLKRRSQPLPPLPVLAPATRQDAGNEVRARVQSFTPEWTNLRPTDAGVALTQLFGEQMEPVLERLNRLPDKTFVEFLNIAGIRPLPASPAAALLEFEISDTAPQSVFLSKGFQVGAQPAEGPDDLVIFETERDLVAAPVKIVELHRQENNLFQSLDPGATTVGGFLPFGSRPEPGRALFIGLAGEVAPAPRISLGIRVAAPPGAPPPLAVGGVAPLPVTYAPQLEWSVLDGTAFVPAEISFDETGGLTHSGVVELRLPPQWRVGRPRGLTGKPLRWLRLAIVSGTFSESPALSAIKPNMVPAIAARTLFNEALEPLPQSKNRQMTLSRKPILPDSLLIEIDEGGFATASGPEVDLPTAVATANGEGAKQAKTKQWLQVDDLSIYGPEAEVYSLDPLAGVVTFGDGVHGALVPRGFRNVRAKTYRVGGGRAGAVPAEAISTLLSSAPFITKVTNPWPATGGVNSETSDQALLRGPQEIRARSRAVTIADYALLARQAQGALVARAHAVAGLHPAFPGRPIPGVVGIFVVPPDRNEGPPTPDEDSLRAVATYLSRNAAPAGVEVVAAAARFHRVKIEAVITIRSGADAAGTVRDALQALEVYLHPLTGGEDGSGWPFGGPLRYQALVRRLTRVAGVSAVPTLNIIADGSRFLSCHDFIPEPHALLWSEVHQVIVQQRRESR